MAKKWKSIKRFPAASKATLMVTQDSALSKEFPGYKRDDLRNLKHELVEAAKGTIEDQFQKFLLKAKNLKQIQAKFGNETERLLEHKFDGLNLFQQRDNYNELVYILLPEPPKDIELKPRKFTYHIDPENPYMVVQLPDFKKKVIVAPLYDVHYGHHAHKSEKFLGYLRWIAETPNVYAILGGDTMENALDDGRGMYYDQEESPGTQLDEATRLLAPIAHRILVAVPGNHEERTRKRSGIDVMQILAERLKIPYFPGPVLMDVMGNTYKWAFYVWHGAGNAQTKGGKMNMAARPKGWTGVVNFIVAGHVHDCIAEAEVILVPDPLRCRLVRVKQWIVVAQSFLGWYKTYAYRFGWKPPADGGVSMELFDDGRYRAYLTE